MLLSVVPASVDRPARQGDQLFLDLGARIRQRHAAVDHRVHEFLGEAVLRHGLPDGADLGRGREPAPGIFGRYARGNQRGRQLLHIEAGAQRSDAAHPLTLQPRSLGARRVEYHLVVTGFRARLSRWFHCFPRWAGCPSCIRSHRG